MALRLELRHAPWRWRTCGATRSVSSVRRWRRSRVRITRGSCPRPCSACSRRLHARAADDPRVRAELPDLVGSVRALLARLERAPVAVLVHPGMADEARIVVGAYDLRVALAQALATTRGTAGIPRLLVALERGDFGPLAVQALERRRGSLGSAMALAMDCASGATHGAAGAHRARSGRSGEPAGRCARRAVLSRGLRRVAGAGIRSGRRRSADRSRRGRRCCSSAARSTRARRRPTSRRSAVGWPTRRTSW